mmetsp:Transcript_40748/g.107674  ORF Transcript_40748/g.107674 Transcript_40748/m.107674 type:complete len:402 (+) Transcript_40748:830-2035(+)
MGRDEHLPGHGHRGGGQHGTGDGLRDAKVQALQCSAAVGPVRRTWHVDAGVGDRQSVRPADGVRVIRGQGDDLLELEEARAHVEQADGLGRIALIEPLLREVGARARQIPERDAAYLRARVLPSVLLHVDAPAPGQHLQDQVQSTRRERHGALGPVPLGAEAPEVHAQEQPVGLVAEVPLVVAHIARREQPRDGHCHGDRHVLLTALNPQGCQRVRVEGADRDDVSPVLRRNRGLRVHLPREQQLVVPVGVHLGDLHRPLQGARLGGREAPVLARSSLLLAERRGHRDHGHACVRKLGQRVSGELHGVQLLQQEDVLDGGGQGERRGRGQGLAPVRGLHVREQLVHKLVGAPLVVQRVDEAEVERGGALASQELEAPERAVLEVERGGVQGLLEGQLPGLP